MIMTEGGTLGILIPPSVMIIVYAAVAGQSVVKLYASAMFPGFFLAFLYLVYVVGWALIRPGIAPRLPDSETRVPVAPWVRALQQAYSRRMLPALLQAVLSPARAFGIPRDDGRRLSYAFLLRCLGDALFPLILSLLTLWGTWWYVVIHPQASAAPVIAERPASGAPVTAAAGAPGEAVPPAPDRPESGTPGSPDAVSGGQDEGAEELGGGSRRGTAASAEPEGLEEMGSAALRAQQSAAPAEAGPPAEFYRWFWVLAGATVLLLLWYYFKMEAEQFELVRLLISSVAPLGILTVIVLAVILLGITTATESAAVGAAGAFLLAIHARTLNWQRVKESVFLTAKTTSMVCWLFVGSALFSGVFALLGGQQLVERWVLSFNLTPVQFMIVSQAIIFVLGWPLEWTEIIVIFVPIFLPLLKHFQIDPILWGTLVFVNLQAAFLSPPVAMSAFYLKGVSPPHVTLNQIFSGMMPYMLIVILCMVIMYVWPGMTLWLPNYLYGN